MNNKKYIENIQERMVSYNQIREEAIGYIIENGIKNSELATHLLVIAHLWLANRRGEVLTEQDINMFLNSETHFFDIKQKEEVYLDEEHIDMDVYELFEYAVDIWYSDEPKKE